MARCRVLGAFDSSFGGRQVKLILASLALFSSACTMVRENGKTVFATGANASHLVYRSPAGSFLEIDKLDHAIIIQKAGAAVSQGVMSATIPAMTGGVIK